MGAVNFEVHFDADLADNDVCDRLQHWLRDHSPRFASNLRVHAYERDPDAVLVDVSADSSLHHAVLERGLQRGEVFKALSAEEAPSPYARRFGEVLLRGKAPKSYLGLKFDQFHPGMPMGDNWLWSNSISGHIDTKTIDRIPALEWVRSLVEAFAMHPDLMWAAAYSTDEWHDRNMYDEADGMRALGRDIRRSLPGLFWLNVFGKPYVEHIGRTRLLTVPADVVTELQDAVVVIIHPTPEEWSTGESQLAHEQAVEHLGVQHFYDRRVPDRPQSAPDFGLPSPDRPDEPVQVFADDGEYFIVLPPTT